MGRKGESEDPNRSMGTVIGIACALGLAFTGCSVQFVHDVNGGHGGPVYLLTGLVLGAVVGLVIAFFFVQEGGE